MMHWRFRRKRTRRSRHPVFPFLERSQRRIRWFKRVIAAVTVLLIAGMVAASPHGRHLAVGLVDGTRQFARQVVGMPLTPEERDAQTLRHRLQGIEETTREFHRVFAALDLPLQKLMRYGGNDPETGLLRWGNLTSTLLLPSTIFAPDDSGRSYRLRPHTRSVWLRNLTIQGIPLTFFLVPDGPGLQNAAQGTTAVLVPESLQTTNSWGLRGPEPDPDAPVRGIVLGDSYMQGLFIADDQTPTECLRRALETGLNSRVSLLNTGHLGYSPEQEFFTLVEYAPRFSPRFVVLSLFANDFGGGHDVATGKADWDEGRSWMGRIADFCQSRGILLLTVPVPLEQQMTSRRFAGHYPAPISNLAEAVGSLYLDPVEDFLNEHVKLLLEGDRSGHRPATSPLYNGVIADGHFSAIGSRVWASAVARRLLLLLEKAAPSTTSSVTLPQ